MCRKHGEAIKPAGKNRLEYGSSLFCCAQVDSHAEVLENTVFSVMLSIIWLPICSFSEIFNPCLFSVFYKKLRSLFWIFTEHCQTVT